jgi:hypothetical protein|tara:strand:+ start:1122 stop:1661 length:540 start_codon:yes stop_codon:yes gene_type:complete
MARYFEQFPLMVYDIKANGYLKLVPDIFRRVKMKSKIKNILTLLDVYDVDDGERPEHIAYKLYGESDYFWVVCLVNNIENVYYDWPLSNLQFENYLKDKYDNVDAVHHYEKVQSSGPQIGSGPEDYSHKIEVNSTDAGAGPVTNFEYEMRIQNKKRQIKVLDPQYLDLFIEEFKHLIRQ